MLSMKAWERWIREQDWESVIENHLCPYVEELLLVGDENGETPAQVLVNIALELWTVYGQSEDLRKRIEDTLHKYWHLCPRTGLRSH